MRGMQGSLIGDYYVDIVMCIDLTKSMYDYIEEVKKKVIVFPELYMDTMEAVGRNVSQFRVRVIGFRDFGFSSEPIVDSGKFFLLPEENIEFECFVRDLQVDTGGDIPESGLEAIALALKSDWTNEGRHRHIILLFTDAPAHPLCFGSDSVHYPEDMPSDLEELRRWWGNGVPNGSFKPNSGRLMVFAPEVYPWKDMLVWNRYWYVPLEAGLTVDGEIIADAIDLLVGGIA